MRPLTSLVRLAVFAPILALATLVTTEHDAHALGPIDIEAGLRAGFATKPSSNDANPFGLGIGGRAGVGIFHLYGGISAIHYFGEKQDITSQVGTTRVSFSSTLLGLELGYSITAIPLLTIRPQLGIGNAAFSFQDDSTSHLYLEPGVVVLISLGLVYVGADANVLVVPGIDQGDGSTKTDTSFTLHAQAGIKF